MNVIIKKFVFYYSFSAVLYQIVMENGNFIEFVDEIYRRDELPVWRNVAQLVAAMAAFHHLHNSLKVSLKLYMYDVLIFI